MDGIEKAKLQRKRGTRPIVDELDQLRITFGFDQVLVLTPQVETRLRSGLLPPRPLKVCVQLSDSELIPPFQLEFSFKIGYPEIPVEAELQSSEGISDNFEANMVQSICDFQSKLLDISHEVSSALDIAKQLKEYIASATKTDNEQVPPPENSETLCLPPTPPCDMQGTIDDGVRAELIVDNTVSAEQSSRTDGDLPVVEKVEEVNFVAKTSEALVQQEISYNSSCTFTCRICSVILFKGAELHAHSLGITSQNQDQHQHQHHQQQKCTSYFLDEAPQWLLTGAGDADKMHCCKCKARLGSWSWAGSKCSCGEWIVPAFQIIKSKVDAKFPPTALI